MQAGGIKESVKLKIKVISVQVLEWIIRTFHIYFRRFDKRGLVAAISLASIPLALNLSCAIIYLFYLIAPGFLFKAGFLGTGGIAFINYVIISTYLEGEYVKKKRKLEGGYPLLFHLFPPLYFVGSVWLFVIFFRFL